MKKLLLMALGLMISSLNAQSLQWVKQIGGPGSDGSTNFVRDDSGNIYKLGSFRQTADFDPSANTYNMTAVGQGDLFVAKLDIDGNFIWALQIGENYDSEQAGDIALDSNGNILVGGSFRNTLDLDPGVGVINVTTQGKEAFLLKLDPQGDLIWATHWGGNDYLAENTIYDIVLDDADNIIIGGGFYGTNDLDPGAGTFSVTSTAREDAYLSKLDTNGNFLWAISFGGLNTTLADDAVKAIAIGDFGNIIITGNFRGDIAEYNLSGNGLFYIKLDASGNLVWSKQTDGNGYTLAVQSLKQDDNGNLYMSGRYQGTCDFDPGAGVYTLSSTYGDVFILKLTSTGEFAWAKSIGGSDGVDHGRCIALDNQGYVYVTGNYKGAGDFDPGAGEHILTPIGQIDMFILKLDTDGNFIYANTFGGPPYGETIGTSIQTDDSGNVYFSGVFQLTTDFDPSSGVYNLVSENGSSDIFILKLNGDPLSVSENELLNTSLYPNPSNGKFTLELSKELQNVTLQISNSLGQIISTEEFASAKIIESNIIASAGVYFVKVSTAKEGSKTLRIIKQ